MSEAMLRTFRDARFQGFTIGESLAIVVRIYGEIAPSPEAAS